LLLGRELCVAFFKLLKLVHLPVELLPFKCEALVLLAEDDKVRLQLNELFCRSLQTEVLVSVLPM
jgi:hypothetical protein